MAVGFYLCFGNKSGIKHHNPNPISGNQSTYRAARHSLILIEDLINEYIILFIYPSSLFITSMMKASGHILVLRAVVYCMDILL